MRFRGRYSGKLAIALFSVVLTDNALADGGSYYPVPSMYSNPVPSSSDASPIDSSIAAAPASTPSASPTATPDPLLPSLPTESPTATASPTASSTYGSEDPLSWSASGEQWRDDVAILSVLSEFCALNAGTGLQNLCAAQETEDAPANPNLGRGADDETVENALPVVRSYIDNFPELRPRLNRNVLPQLVDLLERNNATIRQQTDEAIRALGRENARTARARLVALRDRLPGGDPRRPRVVALITWIDGM